MVSCLHYLCFDPGNYFFFTIKEASLWLNYSKDNFEVIPERNNFIWEGSTFHNIVDSAKR